MQPFTYLLALGLAASGVMTSPAPSSDSLGLVSHRFVARKPLNSASHKLATRITSDNDRWRFINGIIMEFMAKPEHKKDPVIVCNVDFSTNGSQHAVRIQKAKVGFVSHDISYQVITLDYNQTFIRNGDGGKVNWGYNNLDPKGCRRCNETVTIQCPPDKNTPFPSSTC